ncbi:MAG: helix-turn-helix domain-containing protein [Candidatus Ozemobacteraceae bacterium]|jgi:transcriptional regulator with XRE-family HTH domain
MRDLEFVFGQLLKDRRIAMGLSPKQLAEKLGYTNIVKGIRRINVAEEGGARDNKLQEIMAILGVTEADRSQCRIEQEKQILEKIKTLPKFKPVLVYRIMACIYAEAKIPEELTTEEQLKEFAGNFARERKFKAWLKLDYNITYFINTDGKVSEPIRSIVSLPYAYVK